MNTFVSAGISVTKQFTAVNKYVLNTAECGVCFPETFAGMIGMESSRGRNLMICLSKTVEVRFGGWTIFGLSSEVLCKFTLVDAMLDADRPKEPFVCCQQTADRLMCVRQSGR